MDPVTIGLAAASALGGLLGGGGDEQQKRKTFNRSGGVDPVKMLQQQLDAIKRLSSAVASRPGVQLRSAVVQGKPNPVNIPGLPFQIGGGLGVDPAIKNPELLKGVGLGMEGDLFGSPAGSSQSMDNPRKSRFGI